MGERISVLGLGNMGAALAGTLLKDDHEINVWNRTESKAEPLIAAGARKASDPAAAIAVSDVVIICVGNYEDSKETLAECGDLTGKTLVQLTTGTASEAEAMGAWVESKGGLYLDGVIIAYPSGIGEEETVLVISGSEVAWANCEKIIKKLGGASMYLGTNLAAPIALEAAMVGPNLMAIIGAIYGAYLLEKAGFDIGDYAEIMAAGVPLLSQSLHRQISAIATNNFSDTEASLGTWAAAINHNVDAFGGQGGIDLMMPIRELLNRAVNAGYADEEIAAAIKVLRQTASHGKPT